MARGMLSPAGLMTLVVLVLFHQTCTTAEDTHQTCTSSCGNIHNIDYPFRLSSDPENCGDQWYNLSCENNQTVLYLYGGRYYVRQINYNNYTIRVVDPSIRNANDYSFTPRYSLDRTNFRSRDPYQTSAGWHALSDSMIFVKCEKPMDSQYYHINISACIEDGVYSSKRYYRYAVFWDVNAVDLADLCQVEQISLTSRSHRYRDDDLRNISCTDFHNELLRGFELSWYRAYCEICRDHGYCHFDEANNNVICELPIYFGRLYKIYKFIVGILKQPSLILIDQLTPTEQNEPSNWRYQQKVPLDLLEYMTIDYAERMYLAAPFVFTFLILKWRKRHLSMYDAVEKFLQSHNNLMPVRYPYWKIKMITESFKDKLGEGGFGTVFKGTLQSGRLVAIKMLDNSIANGQDFISEVATIGKIHHVNVVELIGFCVEKSKRALVYEFMPNGSLNKHIFLPEVCTLLSYDKMYEIALGVARGIEYLHQGCDMQILHFDIKLHNILLDENFTPKISDFGLAKSYPINNSIVPLTDVRGTLGYMAPELFYKNIGGISYKADVYSFGMLLMEIAARRKNLNTSAEHSSQEYFPTWVYKQLDDGNDVEMEDATEEEKKIGKKMIIVALWCIQMKPSDRPSMNKVVQMLEGKVEDLQMPSKPFLLSLETTVTGSGEENSNQSNESSQSSQF